jgi:hypothetical protein
VSGARVPPASQRHIPAPSLLACIGHPAYGPDAVRAGLERFAFLLGASAGEDLFGGR